MSDYADPPRWGRPSRADHCNDPTQLPYDIPYRPRYSNDEPRSDAQHNHAPKQTPFSVFTQQVEALCNSAVGRNLLSEHPDHLLTHAIDNLRKSTDAIGFEYGRLGPDTTWNVARNSYGPRLSTEFNFPRPSTPNNGLHPNTPPRTPDSNGDAWSKRQSKQISDLEAELAAHKRRLEQWHLDFKTEKDEHGQTRELLEKSRRTVARANKITAEQHKNISSLRHTVETLTKALALEYTETSRYTEAADHYEALIQLKAKDMRLRNDDNDSEGVTQAELSKLWYMQEKARVLILPRDASQQVLADVQDTLAFILERRKEMLRDFNLVDRDNREAHLLSCEVKLRSSEGKQMADAESMHESFASLRSLEVMNDEDRVWRLKNAAGLAAARLKQGYTKEASSQLSKVWLLRHHAPRYYRSQLDKQLLEIVSLLTCQDSKYAMKALEMVCKEEPTKHTLRLWTKLGIAYHGSMQQEDALRVLQAAWAQKRDMSTDEQRSTLWALARTQAARNKWLETQGLLEELRGYDNRENEPMEDEVTALRAATQLNLGAFKDAEATASRLYQVWGVRNVLYPSSMFHHVDTLIRAKAKQKKLEKFQEARDVWGEVFRGRKEDEIDAIRGAELVKLCAAAKMLANTWEGARAQRGRTLTSVDELREQVGRVEGMLV